jgi:DNA-binding transcriptional regulator YdaS (Cro superfamily)
MDLSTWLKSARGRQVALARHLGVSTPTVAEWVTSDRPVPLRHAAEIEGFTGGEVTRKAMFPHDWQRIWPELQAPTDTSPKQATAQGAQ